MAARSVTDIVLLGAGHAHVEVLREAASRPTPHVRLTLVTRERLTPYSGLLPGLLRGEVTHAEAHIDAAGLARAAGARLIVASAEAIDLAAGKVLVARGDAVPFDLLSIDVGGTPPVATGAVPVKPIGRFLDRLAAIEGDLTAGTTLAVVGSGAGGTELALALAQRYAGRASIALVGSAPMPVASAPPRARRAVGDALAAAGVEIRNGAAALRHADAALHFADGGTLRCAAALWATGIVGPAFLARSGLACDDAGCVLVDRTLRSTSHPNVFAAGDCAARDDDPRPKAGVWAVRAGPPLSANLRRAAMGRPLRAWTPQDDALVILGTGHGRAVAWRGGFSLSGRWPAHWKNWIDRRWMARYQMAPPPGLPATIPPP